MKVIGVNGSPRKNWNTATLLGKALEGAASQGAETEIVHLYDLDFKGCHSCFACKLKGGHSYGHCAVKDGLTPVLQRIEEADALFLGSPIYFGGLSGEMRSFLERLLFQYLVYDKDYSSTRQRPLPVAILYTMNVNEAGMKERGYPQALGTMEAAITRRLKGGDVLSLYATDTCQFSDYSKYEVTAFDPAHKARRRIEQLPADGQHAFEMGAELIRRATNLTGAR